MADGGGRGHFTTMAEIRETLADHARRLLTVEVDLGQLTDEVVKLIDLVDEVVKRRVSSRRKPKK